jgi:hypothetical protein
MKYLKRFNENQNTSILQQLISTLREKLDYDFDRDYLSRSNSENPWDKHTKDNYKDNYYQ